MPKSKSYKKKYFVKEDDGIYTVYEEYFEDIETREEALVIALQVYDEIYSILIEEAEEGTLYIGNMKITTGLQRSLDELEKRWPCLMIELFSIPRKINGYVIQQS